MTSDFYFTVTSWFPGNVRVKPYSKHSESVAPELMSSSTWFWIGSPKAAKRSEIFVISYLLLWPAFIWQILEKMNFSWLPSKNKVADENLQFQRHTNFLVKLQCSFFHQPAEYFFSKKTCVMKAGWNKTYYVTKTWFEVLCRFCWCDADATTHTA